MIDSGIFIASGISTLMAFISSFILFRYYIHNKKDKTTNYWAVAMFSYASGHFIVTLLYGGVLENSVLTMFIYVNLSGAVTMSLFLFGTVSLFLEDKQKVVLISVLYGSFYLLGSFLYAFIIPPDSTLNFINLSGDFNYLNNMSWFVIETLIPVSIFLSLLFFKDFNITKDRSSFWVSTHFFLYFILLLVWPFSDLKLLFYLGRTLATSCLLTGFTSLTQQRRLESIIYEVETAESDFFLDLLTHDIKNHLQGIKMMTEYLQLKEDAFQPSEFAENIEKNIGTIFDLISNIEKYRTVRKEGHFALLSPMQLLPVIKKTFEQIILNFPYKKVEYELEIDQSLEYLINGNDFVEDIFMNLFFNAIKHNDKDHVKISIMIDSTFDRGVDYWVLFLQDNGPGIPNERRKHIFTGKLRKNGSGIGLSIVKTIVDGYGGKISVKNKINESKEILGSIFEIHFPKAKNLEE